MNRGIKIALVIIGVLCVVGLASFIARPAEGQETPASEMTISEYATWCGTEIAGLREKQTWGEVLLWFRSNIQEWENPQSLQTP